MSATMTKTLRAEATIWATFEIDWWLSPGSVVPSFAIPHSGLMPTGADERCSDKPGERRDG